MQGYPSRVCTVSSSQFESAVRELRKDSLICTSGAVYRYDEYLSISPDQYVPHLMLTDSIPKLSHPSGEPTKLGGTVSFLIQYSMFSKKGTMQEAHAFCTLTEGRAALELNTLLRFIHLIDQRKAYSLLLELIHDRFKDSPVSLAKITDRLDEMEQQETEQLKTEQQRSRMHRAGEPLREPYVVNAVIQGSFSEVDVISQKLLAEFMTHAAQRRILQQNIRQSLLLRDEAGTEEQMHLGERRMSKAVQQLLCID